MRIEIGTSDFETGAGYEPGLYVEPVEYYFNRLPNRVGCIKERAAISNYEGEIKVYYIPPEIITKCNLPNYLRGCNSINSPHPTAVRDLRAVNLSADLIAVQVVPVMRIKTLFQKHNVTEVNYLKVDTEGHDYVILNDLFDTMSLKPRLIKAEANSLTAKTDIQKLINRLESLNYSVVHHGDDILATLK